MVYRVYVEKKAGLAQAAAAVAAEIRGTLGIKTLERLRLLNRYDVEGVDEGCFAACIDTVFSEPQTDTPLLELPSGENCRTFAVEYLPGQFDQRADAAEGCIALVTGGARPTVRTATVYMLYGDITDAELALVKKLLINPVEAREARLERYDTLAAGSAAPEDVPELQGFCGLADDELEKLIGSLGLAMNAEDLRLCREYFSLQRRDPTLTELRVLDTYWSDHCRHTTFLTEIDGVTFDDPAAQSAYERYCGLRRSLGVKKPVTLMDMGTIGARYLKSQGMLEKLDVSPEINACTVRITVEVDGKAEPWLMLFKNETHNHPTEIEPFGGAATCIGGAIRDPLSGRAYVYQAMRVTGAADPRTPFEKTIPGKLPQRKLTRSAAEGYSSYGNQVGLATGLVQELYHPGYAAKRMEVGAVIGAVPERLVRREEPAPGDVVLLLGGKTGRDGCGGATGSSKAHTDKSIELCGAEVQKGNAPEERKLQRLFRNPKATALIKRCNDFGAGGVSVAIGELADGLEINLDAVPKKYEGLSGTELAISESQERMAVVVAAEDAESFIALSNEENILATRVATVTEQPSLVMLWRGKKIVELERSFIDTNGASRHAFAHVAAPSYYKSAAAVDFASGMRALVCDLNACSQRGLIERFDSTVGAGSVLTPLGGARQRTRAQAMAAKLPLLCGKTNACTLMSWGFDPYLAEGSPYAGGYLAVVAAVSKIVASGGTLADCYLSFQEYFPKPGADSTRFGAPVAALLGALSAQLGLELAAIGGKDSMSGSFENMDVPPTLIAFAAALANSGSVISPEFKRPGSRIALLLPCCDKNGLPQADSLKRIWGEVMGANAAGKLRAAYACGRFGVAEAVYNMALGNGLGAQISSDLPVSSLFEPAVGAMVLEVDEACDIGRTLGTVTQDGKLSCGGESLAILALEAQSEAVLEDIFPTRAGKAEDAQLLAAYTGGMRVTSLKTGAVPRVLIPVFPGTNCEYDSARAVENAGATAEQFVVNTLTPASTEASIRAFAGALQRAQVLFLPGGFSNGDEPDGSGKFITAFLRNPRVAEALSDLLDRRSGLALGICNGFQALIKLGLLPSGRMLPPSAKAPTLTFNTIGRHQSRIVRTKITSNLSPWLALADMDKIYSVPISHGEGRFLIEKEQLSALAENGQIASRYVDEKGLPSMDIVANPNGSAGAVEGICSPDGRILGKMGHSERIGSDLYKNVPGEYDIRLFEAAVRYFK